MPKYKVRDGEHIMHDNKEYNGGDAITLTEEQAKALRVDPADEAGSRGKGQGSSEGEGKKGDKK